ncbi:probable polyol transporter 6 [Gastrolobium bilobum]|uniref:probable polyol transporter 6 n=1 Tax=Gastrolobium bilobum TaxID=150636 RepID=UPI002AAFC156|nr:probable polyol transporter 6 [Gastrolobium bilobum]
MQDNSAQEKQMKSHYYYPLPDSDSSSTKADLRNEEKQGTCAHEAPEASSHKHNISEDSVSYQSKSHLNKYALAGAILASTNSILLGYDIGVMSGAVLFIREDLNITSVQVEILVGCLNVCSLIGSLASGKTSDWIGRRYTIILAAATFLIGAVLMGLAPSFPFLMAGRVVAGIGVGYSLTIAPVYVAELSPTLTRGFLTSLPEVFINVGILIGYISNYALSGLPKDINWRLMLGLAALPALFVAMGVLAMPESPRWLVVKGRFQEAKQVLIRTSDNKGEAELRLAEISEAASITNQDNAGHGQGVWKELLFSPSRPVLRILVAAIGVNFFMQASGNDAVVYYSPEVFKEAGIQGEKQLFGVTIIMGITKTCFVFISALFLDRFGRRPMLLLGSSGMAVSLFILGLGCTLLQLSDNKPGWAIALCVVSVCATVSFFSIGLGPITWVYSSEIFPMRLRAQGSSLAISVNRLVSGILSMTFLSISEAITFGGVFFVLSGVMVVGTFFFYYFLPETKGKSLEEIEALFEDDAH